MNNYHTSVSIRDTTPLAQKHNHNIIQLKKNLGIGMTHVPTCTSASTIHEHQCFTLQNTTPREMAKTKWVTIKIPLMQWGSFFPLLPLLLLLLQPSTVREQIP